MVRPSVRLQNRKQRQEKEINDKTRLRNMNKKQYYVAPSTTVVAMDTTAFMQSSGTQTEIKPSSDSSDQQIENATWDW